MAVNKFVRRLVQRVADFVSPPARDLCAPRELEQAIQRERSRVDRTQGQFAVVSFFPNHGRSDRRRLLPLVDHLKRRSRTVDDLGWSHDNKLCLVLANCSPAAAANLAAEMCRDFSSDDLTLAFTLFHYAADGRSGNHPGPLSSDAAVRPAAMKAINPACRSRAVPPLEREPPESAEQSEGAESSAWELASSMEVLLVRDMPWWKRTLDVTAAAAALILLAPLFAIIALAIKLSSPGPMLFQQIRSGRGGQPFTLYKFRSMVPDAEIQKSELLAMNEQDGPAFKMENDPRVTRVGRILRAFSMDELPQLWNVLRGDMSLVGPRPLPINEAEACVGWQRQRTDVTPGLTCFWQVQDRRAKIPFVDWARMDIRYIGGRSPWVDLRLLVQTVLFIIRRKGV